ncbi:hypothetical protein M408DRAFT_203386 [Serendipita vermifera MAFF 305830]|uniref:Uncharacterized protein n=1 Tax=Serendipita vermifera MAFF 305830 TaxID=933852 RepID=A0A0C3AMD2_SERVB|nr:hypothetical protein M408DRAFT_203386 [Serendipita vermifera MAFF 305830]
MFVYIEREGSNFVTPLALTWLIQNLSASRFEESWVLTISLLFSKRWMRRLGISNNSGNSSGKVTTRCLHSELVIDTDYTSFSNKKGSSLYL